MATNQNVVEEYQNKLPKVVMKDVVHERLESLGSVGETEWHHEELVMPFVSTEGRLGHILASYPNLMITQLQIQLREHGGFM